MTDSSVTVSEIYTRPCVNGNSSTGQYFNFSVSVSSCHGDNCTALNAQPGASIISPIILSLTGISGHIVALLYLHHGSRPSTHRTTFYIMLATLIWTDLIGKIITTPLPVMSYVYGHWIGGEGTCNIHGYSMSMIGLVTHFLVAVMALERYLGIRCGYFYNRAVTTSRTRMVLIILWMVGVLFCSLPLLGIGEFKLHYPGTWCHINQHICWDHPWSSKIFSNLYSAINLTCLFLVVFCNFIVVGSLLKMRVSKYKPSKSCRQMSEKKPREKEIQMVIILIIITITFIFSWAPHDVLMIKNQIWPPPPNQNPLMDIKAIRLVAINQIVDPWSYIICRIIFRSKMWGCCRTVIIGKIGSKRRFSSRFERDGNSPSYSFQAARVKVSTLSKQLKRASLPNPAEMRLHGAARAERFRSQKENSIMEGSVDSSSDHECRVDLQSCFVSDHESPKRKSPIKSSLIKFLLPSNIFSKYKQSDSPCQNDLPMLEKTGCEDAAPVCSEDHPNDKKDCFENINLLKPSCLDKMEKGIAKHSWGNLSAKQNTQFPLSQAVEDSSSQMIRSNSWCCSEEYTSSANLLRK